MLPTHLTAFSLSTQEEKMVPHKRIIAVSLVALLVVFVLALTLGDTAPPTSAGAPAAPEACPTPQKNWRTKGNCSMNPSTYFLGTTDNQPLVLKTNGTERMRILTNGNVGIGATSPAQSLQINGITSLGPPGSVYGYLVAGGSPGPYPTLGFNTYAPSYLAGVAGYGGIFQFQDGD